MRVFAASLVLASAFHAAAWAGPWDGTVSAVSDTVFYFEKAFNARARVEAWFPDATGSTLRYAFGNKGAVVFHLTGAPGGPRHLDLVQVEPMPEMLSSELASGYAKFIVQRWRQPPASPCEHVRDDDDGFNAFYMYNCPDKSAPKAPSGQLTVTIQTTGGRKLIFVQFTPQKR
jgi:hypothetical protein